MCRSDRERCATHAIVEDLVHGTVRTSHRLCWLGYHEPQAEACVVEAEQASNLGDN